MKKTPVIFFGIVLGLFVQTLQAGMLREMIQKRLDGRMQMQSQQTQMFDDIPYGSDPKQRMDVYLAPQPKNSPILVMVHGGAWKIGDKKSDSVVENKVRRWNPQGVIVVSVNYRLLPQANPIVQADDVAHALAYVQSHAKQWGGDPRKIVLMGHSAGAHLVSLISADPTRYPELSPWLATVSLDSAGMNIPALMGRHHYDFYDEAFGQDPSFWERASPYHRLSRGAPAMMLVCSTERPDKPCEELAGFVQKGRALGMKIEVLPQPKSHKEINEDLGLEGSYTNDVEMFLRLVGYIK